MNKLEKYLPFVAIIFSLIAVVLVSTSFKTKTVTQILGGGTTPEIALVASSSSTYFNDANAGGNTRQFTLPDGTKGTGTTTLLTVDRLFDVQQLALEINSVATDTNANVGTIYVQPEFSYNSIEWARWTPPVAVNGAAGGMQAIYLGNASSTPLVFTPGTTGTSTIQYVFNDPVGRYVRFRVWATGTTTVWLKGYKQINN